jgi:hypothetical protein
MRPISVLKDAIKDKKTPALDHLAADALKIWKVSIPVNDGFEESMRKSEFREEEGVVTCGSIIGRLACSKACSRHGEPKCG